MEKISLTTRKFIITDRKYHDSNALDMIIPQPDAIYLMDMTII